MEDIYVCVHDIAKAVPSPCLGTRKVILLLESRNELTSVRGTVGLQVPQQRERRRRRRRKET